MARVSFYDFNKRLWLAGGRDQAPDGTLRRARGVAPELTGSIQSMFPAQVLYNIKALNLIRYNGVRYQFDGSTLYANGVALQGGFNGNRAALVEMPPSLGLQDYLFVGGAGKNVKVAPDNTISNWGIQPPFDGMTGTNLAADQIVIDSFDSTAANWSPANCTISNNNSEFQYGTGSLEVVPGAAAAWHIKTTVGYPQNFAVYADGQISLPSDVISLWAYFRKPTNVVWLWIEFDVNDGTFKKDYYRAVVQLVQTTANAKAAGATLFVIPNADAWIQIAVAKSAFQRFGTNLNLDWSGVVATRISGGNAVVDASGPYLLFDNFLQFGGSPLGAGPAVTSGGSEYQYYATFLNLTTGNQSNPQPDAMKVDAVAINKVSGTQVPVSPDPQVTARNLWRTSAVNLAGILQQAYYLDTIYDNTTTDYIDQIADTPGPITITPWVMSATYALDQYLDAGNGFYFQAIKVVGNTGAVPPVWNVPDSTWAPLAAFFVNTTIAPRKANGHFWKCTVAGVTGIIEPNWALGGTLVDGTVTWQDSGVQVTLDGGVTWQFQGINDVQVLGTEQMELDNIVIPATVGDAVGPWQGSMVWTRDSAPGAQGRVYISPPGSAEGYGLFLDVSTQSDPAQKVVLWQGLLWLFTTNAIYSLQGTYPDITATKLYDNSGTAFPFTVVSDKRGVFYRDQDAIHGTNFAENPMVGFEQLATILRNQPAENLPAFKPTIGGFAREEIYWSDEQQVTLAINLNPETGHAWRSFNIAMDAIYYEEETGEIVMSWDGYTGLWEHPVFVAATPGDNLRVTTVNMEVLVPNT